MNADMARLAALVKAYGYRSTLRALTHLMMVSVYLRDTGEVPPTLRALRIWWNASERTTDREAAAWRKVSGGVDAGEAARNVVASGVLDELFGKGQSVEGVPIEVGALLLPRFVPLNT